jgi:predicted phosphodiesterase
MKFGIVLSDAHIPFQHKTAWNLALKVIRETRPDYVVSVGDLADMLAVMAHAKSKNQRNITLLDEINRVNPELDRLGKAAGKAEVHWVLGNHESRFERYIAQRAPELEGMTSVEQLFRTKERGWHVTQYKDHLQLGKLYITHDVGVGGDRAHIAAEKDFAGNVITGHNHRQNWSVVGNARGSAHVTATGGWLGDPKFADYMGGIQKLRYWTHGFNAFDMLPNGTVFVHPVPIVDGQCVVRGKLFKV